MNTGQDSLQANPYENPPTREIEPDSQPSVQSRAGDHWFPFALGLGANLGDPTQTLRAAAQVLAMHNKVRALRLSPLFGSKPVGYTAQPDFTNAAAIGETSMAPHELLATLQAIEARFGRVRSERYGPRTLDLDLLLFADQQLSTPELSLPHPEMTERGFVLAPLACLAPGWVHPGRGETIADLLRRWYEAGGGGVVQLAPA